MKVAEFPDYRKDNPYQQLLANALTQNAVEVTFPQGYRRGLPFSRSMSGKHRVDVLHLHWLTPYLKGKTYPTKAVYALKLLLDLWLVKVRGVRLVWTIHNFVSHESTTPGLEIWLSRRLAALADSLIVHSEGAMEVVTEKFKVCSEKIVIIPHGDFADAYGKKMPRVEARQRLGLDQQMPVFLFFGMIRPYKGVESLLKVWKETHLLHQHAVLIIAGDARDPDLAKTVSSAAADIPNVHLHMRFIPDDEVPVYFSSADYAVFPFMSSLTSGSVALARSYDLPQVAPMLNGTLPNHGQIGRYLYDPNDINGLATMMIRILFTTKDKTKPLEIDPLELQTGWLDIATAHYHTFIRSVRKQVGRDRK